FGVRPITGAEVSLDGGAHITLLVESSGGYANLCRILTEAHAGTRRPGREGAGVGSTEPPKSGGAGFAGAGVGGGVGSTEPPKSGGAGFAGAGVGGGVGSTEPPKSGGAGFAGAGVGRREPLPPSVALERVAGLNEGLVCLSGCARSGLGL